MVARKMLTDEEVEFLASLNFGPEDVYDIRGLPQKIWKRSIRDRPEQILLGRKCDKAGHRLRGRSGHCIQCSTRHLGYQKQYQSDKYVYIAGSLTARLVKIGNTVDWKVRKNKLRYEKQGGASDWEILYLVKTRRAGEIEDRARARIKNHVVCSAYWKDGAEQIAIELLDCSFSKALAALEEVLGDAQINTPWQSRDAIRYEFSHSEETI